MHAGYLRCQATVSIFAPQSSAHAHVCIFLPFLDPICSDHLVDLAVAASDYAMLYVILSPTGPYFKSGPKPISLLAVSESVRSWPGGTGGHKLGLNYAPGFLPQRIGTKQGYDQILWLLGDDKKITEAGAMNFFVIVQRDDGGAQMIPRS